MVLLVPMTMILISLMMTVSRAHPFVNAQLTVQFAVGFFYGIKKNLQCLQIRPIVCTARYDEALYSTIRGNKT